MILEVAELHVKSGMEAEFEAAMREAAFLITRAKGYIAHEVQRCMEDQSKYFLFVKWEMLDDHTKGFRGSDDYQEWRKRLHHFYERTLVEHYERVRLTM